MALDPGRTVSELRELHALTGTADGAQRVAWSDSWAKACLWLAEKLATLPVRLEVDEAGNQWATLPGESEGAVVIGGHIDSVPDGGWLDGCLNVLAGLEVLRRLACESRPPRATVRLVNWADEEGSRFGGRSTFGSMAAAGRLDVEEHRVLRDRDGLALPDVLAAHGVDLDRVLGCRRQLEGARAYIELHIEQGPVLEALGLPLAAVLGTVGLERHVVEFRGQAAHAGSTPIEQRRDAFLAAARFALEMRRVALRNGGVCTVGSVSVWPGLVSGVPGACTVSLDQRHLDATVLARMVSEARESGEAIGREERVEVTLCPTLAVAPQPFHPELVELAGEAVQETAGMSYRLPSGPLHDATAVASAGVPAAMLFVQSLNGLSHAKEEDTRPEHLELAVQALDRLVAKTIDWVAER